ncbi:MAG: cell division topological specificity factor MinE [Cyanobacteria bacterium J06641_5]
MLDLVERLLRRSSPSSPTAKQRLKVILAHDRAGLSPEMLEAMRRDILEVVARYVEIDDGETEIALESDDGATALIANLPIRRIKRESPY